MLYSKTLRSYESMICSYLLHLVCHHSHFQLHRRTRLTPRSSIHSLKIRMTSHSCNKYEQIMLSYLLSVNYDTDYYAGCPKKCPICKLEKLKKHFIYTKNKDIFRKLRHTVFC